MRREENLSGHLEYFGCSSAGATKHSNRFKPKNSIIDRAHQRVFIGCRGGGDGALSVFHEDSPDKYTLVENVKTQPGTRTMALDYKTGKVYLAVADLGPRPDAEPGKPHPRAPILPGTFSVLVIGQ